jgi:hypothetical protein
VWYTGRDQSALADLQQMSNDGEFVAFGCVDVAIALLSNVDANAVNELASRFRAKFGYADNEWEVDAAKGVWEADDGVSSSVLMWYTGDDPAAVADLQERSDAGEFLAFGYVDVAVERVGDEDDAAVIKRLEDKIGSAWQVDTETGVTSDDGTVSLVRMWYIGQDRWAVADLQERSDADEFRPSLVAYVDAWNGADAADDGEDF